MLQELKWYNESGHAALATYDPETADMEEVNREIKRVEKATGGHLASESGGEFLDEVTKETQNPVMVRQLAGG